jgi:hypothetical protein
VDKLQRANSEWREQEMMRIRVRFAVWIMYGSRTLIVASVVVARTCAGHGPGRRTAPARCVHHLVAHRQREVHRGPDEGARRFQSRVRGVNGRVSPFR